MKKYSIKQIRFDRLARLAKFLQKVPREKFDLDYWVAEQKEPPTQPNCKCDTVACAIGWAGVLFSKQGLKIEMSSSGYCFSPHYRKRENWGAVYRFFGLEDVEHAICEMDSDGWKLFSSDHYPDNATPKMVARRILNFIARKKKELRKLKTKA